ncbi:MAG TPA: tetratricopeptide repeat protein, partial [Actinocrinis sp.]|uniref:ATP-binding protein n=1 Tax=Actinocrinis sp. TaxID=1920516 RepID=UPI002DDD6537
MRTAADLARVLRELRRRHARQLGRAEASYRELAEAAGWSHGIIGEYLAGRVLPPTDRFDVLVRLLGATPAELGVLATARDRVEEARRLARRDGGGHADGATRDSGGAGEGRTRSAPIPRQLPMDVYGFTGRARELAVLDALAFAQPEERARAVVVSAVSGTAGVGKTALAVHWAHRAADRFPDGQLYLDLRGYGPEPPVDPADALARLLRGLGVTGPQLPAETADRAALYRTVLAERRILVLLDNAATAEQARPLLPGAPSCFVVVTSRDDLAGLVVREGARRIGLDTLTADEAVILLRTLIGSRLDGGAAPVAEAELTELAERCTRLPLALRIAAELASANPGRSPAELLAGLRDEQRRLDLLDAAGDPRTAVRSVFSWSYQYLSEAGARAFALIGLHPSREFDAYALAALADLDQERASALISELCRAHLAEPAGEDGIATHDLLRVYAAERAEETCSAEERRAALSRLFEHYVGTAAAAMDTLFPHERRSRPDPGPPRTARPPVGDPRGAAHWLEQRRGALVAAGVYAGRHGWPEHCVNLSRVLWRAFEVGGHYQEALTLHSCAVQAAPEGSQEHAAVLTNLGSIHWWLGDHHAARAHFEHALEGHQRTGDRDGEARALARLGLVHERLGDYRAAAEHMGRALESYRAGGDRHGEGAQLINLGALRRRLGDREQAARGLRRAAEIFVELGDPRLEGYALGNLAVVESEAGRHAEALAYLERALELCRRAGDRGAEGSALSTIGAVHGRTGHFASALEYLHRGLAVSRETGDRSLETETLNSLGETLLAMEQPGSALTRHRAALDLAERNGDRFEQARALCGIAEALDRCGRAADGRECRARAREIR